jgi:ribosome maturation factor RimP
VGLKLAGGEKLRGSISAIDEQGLVLSERNRPVRHIAYDEVAQLRLAERAYRATGESDPAAARRIVVNLGVGRHAAVKFAGKELHGHIQAIEADHFTLMPDRQTAPVSHRL